MSDEQEEKFTPTTSNSIEELQKELTEALAQAQSNLEGWKRTAADLENFQRRRETENKELVQYGQEATIIKLLPILDSLEQALKHMPLFKDTDPAFVQIEFEQHYSNWQKGAGGIVVQLDKALDDVGVKKIESVGKKFDPHMHEAVRETEGDVDGIVVEELMSGFELNGKVIRPSQVVISKKAENN